MHRDQRAERVAVGVLVRDEDEACSAPRSSAQHLVARRAIAVARYGHSDVVVGSVDGRLAGLVGGEDLADPHAAVDGLVVGELERRRVLEAQLAGDALLQEAVGRAAGRRASRPAPRRRRARSRTRAHGAGLGWS